jgi:hypothetical protein
MNFQEFLSQFKDNDAFISASFQSNSSGDFSECGNLYIPGHPEYMMDVEFYSKNSIIRLQFEGADADDIMEQATDHVNLILVCSTV